MAERQEFMMTNEQMDRLLNAIKPVPYMVFGGQPPMPAQERANIAWRALADEMGFVWDTVHPIPGKSAHYFAAEPKATKEQTNA